MCMHINNTGSSDKNLKAVPSWKKNHCRELEWWPWGPSMWIASVSQSGGSVFAFGNQMVVELDSESLIILGFNSWFSSLQGETSKKHAGQILLLFIAVQHQEVSRTLCKLLHGLARNGGVEHDWPIQPRLIWLIFFFSFLKSQMLRLMPRGSPLCSALPQIYLSLLSQLVLLCSL